MAYNLLTQPLFRTGCGPTATLPDLLARLSRDDVEGISALRPHQEPSWHMFLVQLAALALHKAARTDLPLNEKTWRDVLRGLTPAFPNDEPWCLVVADPNTPAFLQPPIPQGVILGTPVPTADALDLLITSKNHDLKQAVAEGAEAEDWVFALVSLQTGEGYGGSGNQGISRMNGGSSSRPMLGLAPISGDTARSNFTRPGAWFRRDVAALLALREQLTEDFDHIGYPAHDGWGLMWLAPWPEGEQLALSSLDIWYVEVCRRVRLSVEAGVLKAKHGTSKATRTAAKHLNGVVGDPWAPVHKADHKSLTLSGRDFDYHLLVELLFSGDWELPVLARPAPFETTGETMLLVAAALSRGNSKTEGFKSRTLPVGGKITRALTLGPKREALHVLAKAQMAEINLFIKALCDALALLAAGGDWEKRGKEHYAHARPARERLDRMADGLFFDHLWKRFEAEDGDDQDAVLAERTAFAQNLYKMANDVFEAALPITPCRPSLFRLRAEVRARRAFRNTVRKSFPDLSHPLARIPTMLPLEDTIKAISNSLRGLNPGSLAELRRMEPGGVGTPIFWRLAAENKLDQSQITTWQQIVRILAILSAKGKPELRKDIHNKSRRLGEVLCDGGNASPDWGKDMGNDVRPVLSEERFGRFLALPAKERGAALERLARQLARTRDPEFGLNCLEIATLLLTPEKMRPLQDLAHDFYNRLDRAALKPADKETV